ncbi:MAG: SAM-dependent methyltransferase [Chloroflexota bacterium]
MGILYVVNQSLAFHQDVTQRALRLLRQVSLVAAGHIAAATAFLERLDIETPLIAGDATAIPAALETLDRGDVALLVAAEGVDLFSAELVRQAGARGHAVVSVPGPSMVVAALVVSGLPTHAFLFLHYLPTRSEERRRLLASVAAEPWTMLALVADGHLGAALDDLSVALGDRSLAVSPVGQAGRDTWRGTVGEARAYYAEATYTTDWLLVIGGAGGEAGRWSQERVEVEVGRLLAAGTSLRVAARQVAEAAGWRAREVYDLVVSGRFHV